MFIVFIQASLLSFIFLSSGLLQETCLFNLDWFEKPFTQQEIILVLLKFSLLSYDLNTVCMIRMQKVRTTFKTGWRISRNVQFDMYRPSTRLPGYCNWRCHKVVKIMMLHASSDILAWLGESRFQTRKCHFRHEHWSLMMLKIWSISAKY